MEHTSVAELFLAGAERTPDAVALRRPQGDGWWEMSYAELGQAVREIALGLVSLGVAPGERVALLANTRPEWTMADGGIACAGCVVVPIYHTSSPQECRHVLVDSGARAVVCEDERQLAKIQLVRGECPELEHLLVLGASAPRGALSLDALRRRGAQADPATLRTRLDTVRPEDPATIVYTSGTTGPPKGCVLTHANWLATIEACEQRLDLDVERFVVFLFLPLAHALARITQLVTLHVGGTLAFWSGDAKLVMDEVAAARPTHLPVVPRVLEKVHARTLDASEKGGAAQQRVFAAALSLGRRAAARRRARQPLPPALRIVHAGADRLVLSHVREAFGDRLRQVLVGAAPIDPQVLVFLEACGVHAYEGWGMTETCAAGTLNAPGATRIGTVGRPLPGVEARIAADGEILLRGPNVFPGYWRNETATREVLDEDGWLRTGDLGSIDESGYLRITGRAKDLIITSSGKNVTPSNLEAALREIRWVSQAVAYGDRRPYLVAALTLDADEASTLAERLDLPPDVGTLAAEPRVRELLETEVEAVNARFARIEQIKRFAILDHDLTQAAGELTPTMKVRRPQVYAHYADVFDDLYETP